MADLAPEIGSAQGRWRHADPRLREPVTRRCFVAAPLALADFSWRAHDSMQGNSADGGSQEIPQPLKVEVESSGPPSDDRAARRYRMLARRDGWAVAWQASLARNLVVSYCRRADSATIMQI